VKPIVSIAFLAGAVLSATAFGGPSLTYAQETSRQPKQNTQQKQSAKAHKVWTEDDLGSIRSRGDVTVAAAQNPTVPASTETASAPTPAATSTSKAPTGKRALSNPKTTDEADRMIDWEQRDIDSQQQYVDQVQEQLDRAPADQKEQLQKVLAERQQILADVRREQQELIAQKKLLDKKSAGGASAASTQPPQ
jgi:hypothetical protein